MALAAKPTIERIEIAETFQDDFLTQECGVAVTTTVQGHMISRTFDDRTRGVTEVFTINIGLLAVSDHGEFRFRDVGADVTRVMPDGTVVISIIGQVPFEFTGIAKLDEHGDVIFQSNGNRGAKQLAQACATLTP